ncbi:MAG: hypothetical protein QNJ32_07955 [Xenococcaceae cyanobacterium MO_167.B27]|nr:hypothetical protein [Xenococcaceae cyanobacterium MO_167.B27]
MNKFAGEEDPLKKIKTVDVNTYYDGLFKDYRSVLERDYSSDIYVSQPSAYIIEGEIVAFAPWVPTETEYTIFVLFIILC